MTLFELVAKLTLNTEDYEKSIGESKDITSKLGDGLKTFGKLAAGAFAAAETAVAAFAKSSVDTGMKFDSSMSQLAATMGTTVDQIGELRDFAQKMGRTTAFSASEAADALNILAMAGYNAEQQMETLPAVLNLAAAGGLGIAQAADYATGILAGFGLEMSDAERVSDMLAKTASSAKGDVASFGEGLSTVAGMARTTGQDIGDMSTALGILGNNNFSASEAGNALSRTLRNLYQPSSTAVKAIEALGLEAYDAEGKARPLQDVLGDLSFKLDGLSDQQKNNILSQIFDAATLKSVPALLNAVAVNTDNITNSLRNSGVQWSKYADDAYSGEEIMDMAMKEIIADVRTYGLTNEEIMEEISQQYGLTADDASTAIESVRESLANETSDWDTLSNTIQDSAGAAQDMANTQLDNLAGDITLFKSALEGAQIALSDKLSPSLREFVQFGTRAVSAMTARFQKDGLSGMMDTFSRYLTIGIQKFTEMMPSFINAGMQLLGAVTTGFINALPTMVAGIGQIFMMFYNTVMEQLPIIVENGSQMLHSLAEGLVTAIPDLLSQALPMLVEFTGTIRENLGTIVDSGIEVLMGFVQGLINAMPDLIAYVPDIIINICGVINDNMPKILAAGVSIIWEIIKGLVQNIPNVIANMGKIVQAMFSVVMAFNWLDLGSKVVKLIGNGLKALAQLPVNIFKNIGNSVIRTFQNGFSWSSLGQNIINGIVSGIRGAGSAIKDTLMGFARNAWSSVKSFFGISSPSKLMRDTIGKYIPEGLAVGITANADSVYDAMDDLSKATVDAYNPQFGDIDTPTGTVNNAGGITINVYPREGQSEQEIAQAVMERLDFEYNRMRRAFG